MLSQSLDIYARVEERVVYTMSGIGSDMQGSSAILNIRVEARALCFTGGGE